jgi:hypothetical protein
LMMSQLLVQCVWCTLILILYFSLYFYLHVESFSLLHFHSCTTHKIFCLVIHNICWYLVNWYSTKIYWWSTLLATPLLMFNVSNVIYIPFERRNQKLLPFIFQGKLSALFYLMVVIFFGYVCSSYCPWINCIYSKYQLPFMITWRLKTGYIYFFFQIERFLG